MGLCQNVYRRGGIYWWRRRFGKDGASRTLALSLRVHDPHRARVLGATLNAKAAAVAARLNAGITTMDLEKQNLERALGECNFVVSEKAQADAEQVSLLGEPLEAFAPFSREEEHAMLLAIAREREAYYDAVALNNRSQLYGDSSDVAVAIEKMIANEKAMAHVYRLVADHGPSARVDEQDQESLVADGFSGPMIGFIKRETRYQASQETSDDWNLGQSRAYFVDILRNNRVDPSHMNIDRIRRGFLRLSADILANAASRYHEADQPIVNVLSEIRERVETAAPPITQSNIVLLSRPVEKTVPTAPAIRESSQENVAPAPPKNDLAARLAAASPNRLVLGLAYKPDLDHLGEKTPTFIGSVEALCRQKVKDKEWTEKTAAQHLAIAGLFSRLAETDDPRSMGQDNIGNYRAMLSLLPKNYGKSSKDKDVSLFDIIVRGDDMDEDEVGLDGPTINRHMTQFATILAHFRSNGIVIGTIFPEMRVKKGSLNERPCFTDADLRDGLFQASIWMGAKSFKNRLLSGTAVIHDALYWVPLLGHYLLLRLSEACGLLVKDINIAQQLVYVRDNSVRRLKTPEATRALPIPPEMLRLGFLEYVEAIATAGHILLFPELRLRGDATPLQNLFYKDFSQTLWSALPQAQLERKSFHCFRKTGNTKMVEANVDPIARHQIMGHKGVGVNAIHYTAPLSITAYMNALAHIPIVTAHIIKHPIRLHDGLVSSKKSF